MGNTAASPVSERWGEERQKRKREGLMPLFELAPNLKPAWFDVQQTTFSHDVLGRYTCSTWGEVAQQASDGGYPFDVIVIGAGMFGGYCAEKLYRHGQQQGFR